MTVSCRIQGDFGGIHLDMKASGDFNLGIAKPNPAHYALARMEKVGAMKCVITQNVDNLHQKAGSVEVVEFHGNLLRAACMRCKNTEPIEQVEARLQSGEWDIPRCSQCGGLVKPDAVFFGEAIPPRALSVSQIQTARCDVLLLVGTSLQVYPAAQIPQAVKFKNPPAVVIEVNREPSALQQMVTDVLILGSAGEILEKLADKVEEKLQQKQQAVCND